MTRLFAFIFLLTAAQLAPAKCKDQWVEFTGSVKDASGGAAVRVAVGVSWNSGSIPGGPALGTTDSAGRYAIHVEFPKWSGASLLKGDKCDARLRAVSVSAYSSSHRSRYLLVQVADSQHISVPDLVIDQDIPRTPLFPERRVLEIESKTSLGHGYRMETRAEEVQGGFESVGHFQYCYYRKISLGNCGKLLVSPSGRHALYQDGPSGLIRLFDSRSETSAPVNSVFSGLLESAKWEEPSRAVEFVTVESALKPRPTTSTFHY